MIVGVLNWLLYCTAYSRLKQRKSPRPEKAVTVRKFQKKNPVQRLVDARESTIFAAFS
jgi:hypothetical protein